MDIAPLWTPDWLIGSMLGFGPLACAAPAARSRRAHAARRRSADHRRRPLGGRHLARLAMGRSALQRPRRRGRRRRWAASSRWARRTAWRICPTATGTPVTLPRRSWTVSSPGAYFAPRTAYLSVGARYARRRLPGLAGWRGRLKSSRSCRGRRDPGRSGRRDRARLGGPPRWRTAADVRRRAPRHDRSPWYGDEAVIDRWWPHALASVARGARCADSRDGMPSWPRISDRGVEQRQLVGLITRRSAVRIRPPQPTAHRPKRPRGPASRGRFISRLAPPTGSWRVARPGCPTVAGRS